VNDFGAARRETIRYHEALYGRLGSSPPGGWPARPHRLVVDALASVTEPVHAYDLGAGIGRHTLRMAVGLPAGSRVTAVDLLPSALDRLTESATRAGVGDRIEVVAADLERYRFPARDAGVVVAFSALEHLSSPNAIRELLARCRGATLPGGVNVIAIFADRREVTGHGTRPALIECPLTSQQARATLLAAYRGWEVLIDDRAPADAAETRDGEDYELRSTLVTFVARLDDGRKYPPPPVRTSLDMSRSFA
jgi:SAM-dependent methyltransferase